MSGSAGDPLTKPAYPNEVAARAWYDVDVALGRIPFTVTRFIVRASPKGLPYNLLLPVAK